MEKITKTLDEYLVKKAPALPKNVKEVLVKIAPWITLLGVIMTVPALLSVWGLSQMMYSSPWGGYMMARTGGSFSLAVIFLLATAVMRGLAVKGLFAKSKDGWNMLFYSVGVDAVYSLLNGQVVGMVISAAISLYLLFQVRSFYK